jgi:hypothetical protein
MMKFLLEQFMIRLQTSASPPFVVVELDLKTRFSELRTHHSFPMLLLQ